MQHLPTGSLTPVEDYPPVDRWHSGGSGGSLAGSRGVAGADAVGDVGQGRVLLRSDGVSYGESLDHHGRVRRLGQDVG